MAENRLSEMNPLYVYEDWFDLSILVDHLKRNGEPPIVVPSGPGDYKGFISNHDFEKVNKTLDEVGEDGSVLLQIRDFVLFEVLRIIDYFNLESNKEGVMRFSPYDRERKRLSDIFIVKTYFLLRDFVGMLYAKNEEELAKSKLGELFELKMKNIVRLRLTPQFKVFAKIYENLLEALFDKVRSISMAHRNSFSKFKIAPIVERILEKPNEPELFLSKESWKNIDHLLLALHDSFFEAIKKKLKTILESDGYAIESGSVTLRLLEAIYFCRDEDSKVELLNAERTMYRNLARDSDGKIKNYSFLRLLRFRRDITVNRILKLYNDQISEFDYLVTIQA